MVAKDVGGSFGLKNHPWMEEVSAILAAMLLRLPVKWIEDRIENLTAANQAREQEMTLRAAFDTNGRLIASHADYALNNGAYPMGADANIAVHMFLWAAYNIPAYSFVSRGWYSNTPGLAAYRGPWAIETLARETLLDRAARQIGIDPVEIAGAISAPPPTSRRSRRSASRARTSRRRNVWKSCWRWWTCPPSARSRQRRGRRGAIWAWASPPISSRPGRRAASP
ncbi:molybdopterin cofactor-binding domain-containing protein [Sphingobium scionense]